MSKEAVFKHPQNYLNKEQRASDEVVWHAQRCAGVPMEWQKQGQSMDSRKSQTLSRPLPSYKPMMGQLKLIISLRFFLGLSLNSIYLPQQQRQHPDLFFETPRPSEIHLLNKSLHFYSSLV